MKGTALVYINYLILRYRFEFLVQFGLLNVCVYFLVRFFILLRFFYYYYFRQFVQFEWTTI